MVNVPLYLHPCRVGNLDTLTPTFRAVLDGVATLHIGAILAPEESSVGAPPGCPSCPPVLYVPLPGVGGRKIVLAAGAALGSANRGDYGLKWEARRRDP